MLRPFLFYRFYLDALSLSNVGDFYWSEIRKDFFQVQKEGKENSSSYVHVLYKVALGGFMLYSCSGRQKRSTKKRDTRAVLLFRS